jgi:PAS domain S-box-containing protein
MSSPTIVCVDDEYSVLLELRTQLRRCFPNYAIAVAESGAEAITLVEKLFADGLEVPLVIVDQLGSDMSGEQVLIELHSRHPEILKIMLTSQVSAEDVSNLMDRVNLYRFLPKPWNAIDLQLTVTEALRRYQQDRQLITQKLELEQAKRDLERLHSLEQHVQEHTQQLWQNEKQLLGEAQQHALINTLPDLIMRVNHKGMYLDFIVPTSFPLLGDAQSLIGTMVEDTLPPDLAARRMKAVHDALQTREIQIYEQEIWVDGVLQAEECRVVAYGEDDVLIVGRDISDRKQAEQALKKSEEIAKEREQQLLSLLNNIPHIAWLKDRDGRFLAVNEPFAQACGYTSSQLIGLTDLDIWPHELAEIYRRDDREVINLGKQKQAEEHLLAADGTYRWIETIKSPVVNDFNESIGTAGIAMDITDRKQAELAFQGLMHSTASVTGQEFFPELVSQIAIALDVSHVYLAKQVGDSLEILAWYANRQLQPNFVYQIADTPSEPTLREGKYYCSSVKQTFPHDQNLVGLDVDSYLGVALQNLAGKKIGVICVLNLQPLANPDRAEMLLHIFGARAIAEMERIQVWEDLQNLNEELEIRVQERTKELCQARNFLEAIIENIPLALFVKNGKEAKFGEFVLWNSTCELMFGCSKEQAIGNSVYDFFPKEQSDFFNEKDRLSFALGKPEDIPEEPIDSLTLGRRILHTVKVPIFDEDSNPDYLICISEDITDRKQAEMALQEINERFRATFEQAAVGIAQNSLDGKFVRVNQKYCDIMGYSEAELLLTSFVEITHPEDIEIDNENARRLFSGELQTFTIEKRYIRKDGEIVWANLSVSLARDFLGEPQYVIGVVQDISDRKRSERQLQSERLRLQLALESSEMGTWESNLDTGKWSAKTEAIFGYAPNTSPSNRAAFLKLVYLEDQERVFQSFFHSFTTQSPYNIEYRINRQDGEIRWVAVNGKVVENEDGAGLRMVGVARDITDRKQAEIVLRQYQRMVEIAPDGIALVDRNYTYRLLNQTYLEHNERTWEEMVGISIQDVMGEHTFQTVVKPRFDRCLAGETIDYGEWFYFEKAGNRFVNATYFPYFEIDGTITGVVIINRDVTERREAELLLQDSEERLRLALTAANQGLYDLNPQTGIAIVSPEYATMLGYSPDEFEETNAKWIERLHPEDLERVATTYQAYVNGDISNYKVEFRQRTKNGEWKWILSIGKFVEWGNAGQPLRMLGTHTDISDRKLAEENLQAERSRLQLALDAAKMGSWSCNLQTGKLFWSDRAQEIFGFASGTFPGDRDTFISMIYPEDREMVLQAIARTFETTAPYQVEYRIQRLDGIICWVAVWGIIPPNVSAAEQQLIGVIADISDRKQAELNLRESQRFLQTVIDTFPLAVFWKDRQSVFLGCNIKTAQAAGLNSPTEIIGKTDYDLPWSLEETEIYRADDREVMESNQAKLGVIETQKLANGTTIWIETNKLPLYNLNDEVIGVLGTYQDISDRKRTELERDQLLQELSQLNSELEQANHQLEEYSLTLEQRVEERTNELKNAQERIVAQEKLASLGTLTAGIAHELRNPLNFVKNYAEGSIELMQELLEALQPIFASQESQTASFVETIIIDLQENASTIHRHSLRAAEIISSMMEHSRSEPSAMQSTPLNALLDEAMNLACHAKQSQDANFKVDSHTDYDPEVSLVDVIPNTLMRAFINLIDNACDAMRSKQARLNLDEVSRSTYTPSLRVSTQLMGDTVKICIRDNGCGIPPQIQSKILDPFFTTKPPGSGTGLGLSLTYDIIVKQHQGKLEIASSADEFTEILVEIPIHAQNIQRLSLQLKPRAS